MIPTKPLARLLSVLACAAIAFWPPPTAADETDHTTPQASSTADQLLDTDYVAVGKLEKERSTTRDGYDYIVRDEQDGIRYSVIPSKHVPLSTLVGRRIAVAGSTRYRPDGTAAFVRASEAKLLDPPVSPGQLVPLEGPVTLEQPAGVEQPVKLEQPAGVEQPAKLEATRQSPARG